MVLAGSDFCWPSVRVTLILLHVFFSSLSPFFFFFNVTVLFYSSVTIVFNDIEGLDHKCNNMQKQEEHQLNVEKNYLAENASYKYVSTPKREIWAQLLLCC